MNGCVCFHLDLTHRSRKLAGTFGCNQLKLTARYNGPSALFIESPNGLRYMLEVHIHSFPAITPHGVTGKGDSTPRARTFSCLCRFSHTRQCRFQRQYKRGEPSDEQVGTEQNRLVREPDHRLRFKRFTNTFAPPINNGRIQFSVKKYPEFQAIWVISLLKRIYAILYYDVQSASRLNGLVFKASGSILSDRK